jgi:glycosyltransferase involved in cell wall biosynthesis
MRLLVACHDIVINGGLVRFDRVAAAIGPWGHELAFVCAADRPLRDRSTEVPVLSFEQAAAQRWDAVMVPGAGFPLASFPRFSRFLAPNFGLRVQHVLNDPSRHDTFKAMNEAFQPQIVIFNNAYWPPGSFIDFAGERFHVLLGAVDPQRFRPATYRSHPLSAGRWVVGGLLHKDPEPLIAALAQLPRNVSLRLYGPDPQNVAGRHAGLLASGRLQLPGPLHGRELYQFYRGVDCVVATETTGGWANLAAEGLASGVPVVCTRYGTTAFARHEATALVVDQPSPAAFGAAIQRLRGDAGLCRRLAEEGREAICAFSWETYSRKLLALLHNDGERHHTCAPADGRFGKWPPSDGLKGLDRLLAAAPGRTILDLGAGEGFVGREFLRHGARLVHGIEVDPHRVRFANRLCAEWPEARFRAADLSDPAALAAGNLLPEGYDIVLCLGLHRHLPPAQRRMLLDRALRLARHSIAIRTLPELFEADAIGAAAGRAGFEALAPDEAPGGDREFGVCRTYRRIDRTER